MKKFVYGTVIIFILMILACNGVTDETQIETKKPEKVIEKTVKQSLGNTLVDSEEPEKKPSTLTKEEYFLTALPIVKEMGKTYDKLSIECSQSNLIGVGNEIQNLKTLNNLLQDLKEPPELKQFAINIDKSTNNWYEAYQELLNIANGSGDPDKIIKLVDEANKLLDDAAAIIIKEIKE